MAMSAGGRVPLDGAPQAEGPRPAPLLLRRHSGQLEVGRHRGPLPLHLLGLRHYK